MNLRTIILMLALPFLGGILLAGWAIKQYDLFGAGIAAPAAVSTPGKDETPSLPPALPPQTGSQAIIAPVNGARTEGMLIAYAARRAIDAGQPLGYVADQLQLRFGGSQPQNVAALLSASTRPVSLFSLQSGLDSIGDTLLSHADGSGLLVRVQREASELFILRKEGVLSAAPSQRLLRAKQLTANGNIAAAIGEVQKMPGAVRAKDWLDRARSYVAAHSALDAIERAAATAPEALPVPVTTPSPDQEPLQPVPPVTAPVLAEPEA
jgi:hypothetical protein